MRFQIYLTIIFLMRAHYYLGLSDDFFDSEFWIAVMFAVFALLVLLPKTKEKEANQRSRE